MILQNLTNKVLSLRVLPQIRSEVLGIFCIFAHTSSPTTAKLAWLKSLNSPVKLGQTVMIFTLRFAKQRYGDFVKWQKLQNTFLKSYISFLLWQKYQEAPLSESSR